MSTLTRIIAIITGVLFLVACGGQQEQGATTDQAAAAPKTDKPKYGKIQHVDVGQTIDAPMAKAGEEVFELKCTACHKYDERYVGPPLGNVATKRTPEYVMNMILDTETMIENDDTVKCLMQEYLLRMPNQSVDEKDARNVLEHLRDVAAKSK
jgi:cytochrome c